MIENIIPCLELESVQFAEKVLSSLNTIGNVRIIPKILGNCSNDEINKYAFSLMNSRSSKRKHCKSCGGKHYHFVKDIDRSLHIDEKGICESCYIHLQNMIFLKVPQEKISEWVISEGEINHFDLMRTSIIEGVKKGEINIAAIQIKRKDDEKEKESFS